MSEVKLIQKKYDIESAMSSCLACEYDVKISYKVPYPHETDLAQYLKMRKDLSHHYFDGYVTEDTKENLRQMFVEVNKKMARYLNIITEE